MSLFCDFVFFPMSVHCAIVLSPVFQSVSVSILLFSLLVFTALSLSLFIHSVTVPSLGSFKSLPLLDAALNGKSIRACLFVKATELCSTAEHL